MKRKVRIAHVGCGHVSTFIIPNYYQKGAELVAVFEVNPDIVGKDIGDYLGIGNKGLTISHSDTMKEVLIQTKPDICCIAAGRSLESIKDMVFLCADLGIDVISPTEAGFYPWNSFNKHIAKEIDEYTKKCGTTYCATGNPDVTTSNLISAILSQTTEVKEIMTQQLYNIEGENPVLAQMYGGGYTKEAFEEKFMQINKLTYEELKLQNESSTYSHDNGWEICGAIADQFGWHVTSIVQRNDMLVSNGDLESVSLGRTLKAGEPAGSMSVTTATTEEGVNIVVKFGAKLCLPEEKYMHLWQVTGTPNVKLHIEMANTDDEFGITASAVINRIPSVINAEPGFKAPFCMPNSEFMTKPMNEYVNKDE